MKHFDKSWIGIILVDSSTSAIFKESDPQLRLRREPLHSGFEEFHTPQLFSTFQCADTYPKNRRGSISKTIISYISENPTALELANPTVLSLAYYPLRVVVGEWMLYSQVLGRYMKRYEYSFRNKELTLSQYETMELHKWRHRAMQSLSKLESTRNFVSYHSTTEACKGPWDLVLKDLDHLSKNIEQYGLCLEQMIPVAASMTQLLDTRRSLMESVDVKRLTYVALIFVPLSTVAAIFSMPNDFAPGQPKFWVYFTVAVPLCISIASWLVVKPSLRSLEW